MQYLYADGLLVSSRSVVEDLFKLALNLHKTSSKNFPGFQKHGYFSKTYF